MIIACIILQHGEKPTTLGELLVKLYLISRV
jgi:hypothetical protein